MNEKLIKYRLVFFCIMILTLTQCNVRQSTTDQCESYNQEVYVDFESDTLNELALESFEYHLKKTGSTSIKEQTFESYQMLYQDAWNQGYLLKLEDRGDSQILYKICYRNKNINSECEAFEHSINIEQWNRFKALIYEYDFWTMERNRRQLGVLDGDITYIEGRRPDAEKCNKRGHNLITRASTFYGKAESLSKDLEHYARVINSNIINNK